MDLGLGGKRVLVTGSSRGIGAAVARAFLDEGAGVAITGRTEAGLEAKARELRAEFGQGRVVTVRADFARSESETAGAVRRAVEGLGGLDIVVANVGGGAGPRGLEATQADWEQSLGQNLTGAAMVCRHAVPLMASGGGSIVLVASIAGLEALSAPVPYTAAKAGVIALGKSLARQLAAQRIRVNVVSPGNVLHPEGRWQQRLAEDPEGTRSYIEREVPMRRFGRPEEVASAVLFLASDRAAGFVTGAHLVVDGGQTRSV